MHGREIKTVTDALAEAGGFFKIMQIAAFFSLFHFRKFFYIKELSKELFYKEIERQKPLEVVKEKFTNLLNTKESKSEMSVEMEQIKKQIFKRKTISL